MAKDKDWIPSNMEEFRNFADNFCYEANTNKVPWVLDADDVLALLAFKVIFNPLEDITKVKTSRTSEDIERTDGARVGYEKMIRHIGINQMKNNPNMTNDERTACGVHNDSGTDTPAPIENTSPVIQAANKGSLGLEIRYSPAGTSASNALPDGQFAVVVKFGFYKKGDPVPTEKQCTQSEILGKSPAHVTFDADNFGMLYVGFARYLNTRKELGTVATAFYGVVS